MVMSHPSTLRCMNGPDSSVKPCFLTNPCGLRVYDCAAKMNAPVYSFGFAVANFAPIHSFRSSMKVVASLCPLACSAVLMTSMKVTRHLSSGSMKKVPAKRITNLSSVL